MEVRSRINCSASKNTDWLDMESLSSSLCPHYVHCPAPKFRLISSVEDPGCLSRIVISYPSRNQDPGSRIPDPGSKNLNKREG